GIEVHAVLLGVLKAGAAYVPLDPEYPLDRVRYILQNSEARCLVTSSKLCPADEDLGAIAYFVEAVRESVGAAAETAPRRVDVGLQPDDEAYVIYTSGTTGRPKGVSISHRSVCHLV